MRIPWVALGWILVVSTPGSAQWSGGGMAEPSTPMDPAWMFPLPDTDVEGHRVYFQAFLVPGSEANLVLPDARVPPPGRLGGASGARALLGVWKDCNRDGHVGEAQTGLLAYPANLLPKDTPCRDSFHVNASRVYEWRSIARQAHLDNDPVLEDLDVVVWGDYGKPGGHLAAGAAYVGVAPLSTDGPCPAPPGPYSV